MTLQGKLKQIVAQEVVDVNKSTNGTDYSLMTRMMTAKVFLWTGFSFRPVAFVVVIHMPSFPVLALALPLMLVQARAPNLIPTPNPSLIEAVNSTVLFTFINFNLNF